MTLDRERLIKLLNLTESEYDAEALNAIRSSNAFLRKHRTTWAALLAVPQEPAKARQPEPTQARQQRPRPRSSDAFGAKPAWDPRYGTPSGKHTGRPTQRSKCSSAASDRYHRA